MKTTRSLMFVSLFLVCVLPVFAVPRSTTALSSTGVRVREVSLGDLSADAVRAEARTPVALLEAAGFREVTIPPGEVTAARVIEGLQYADDKLAVIEITGEQLMAALERSVSIYPQKNLAFLQVSGVSFQFDPSKPKGSRVESVKIGREVLNTAVRYRVGTTESLAHGAQGYFTIWGKDCPVTLLDSTASLAVERFLENRESLDYSDLDRITATD